jgi:hypothetical protein
LTINSPVVIAENMIGVAMYELVSFLHPMKVQVADDVLLRLKLAMTIWWERLFASKLTERLSKFTKKLVRIDDC